MYRVQSSKDILFSRLVSVSTRYNSRLPYYLLKDPTNLYVARTVTNCFGLVFGRSSSENKQLHLSRGHVGACRLSFVGRYVPFFQQPFLKFRFWMAYYICLVVNTLLYLNIEWVVSCNIIAIPLRSLANKLAKSRALLQFTRSGKSSNGSPYILILPCRR